MECPITLMAAHISLCKENKGKSIGEDHFDEEILEEVFF